MGTWGYANLENDTAQDILAGLCDDYFSRIIATLQSQHGHEFDEYEHDELFVLTEMLFAMSEHGLVNSAPEPDMLEPLFALFIERWVSHYRRGGHEPSAERRRIIEATFSKLTEIAERACGGSLVHRVGLITKKMAQSAEGAEAPKPPDAAY